MTRLIKASKDDQHRICVTKVAANLLSYPHASSCQDYEGTLCTLAASIIKALCSLYKADQAEQASTLLIVLEQQVGEALAALPDTWRTQPTFLHLNQAAFHLLKAGLKHAPNNAEALRGIRRTLASLPPSGDFENVEQLGKVADETATWLMRVVLHSRFMPIVARRTSSSVVLPWCREIHLPINSIMPLVGSEDDVGNVRKDHQDDVMDILKTEWLTLVDTLLDMLMAYQAPFDSGEELKEQLEALVPVLLSSYSATMSASDRAAWSLLTNIDQFMHATTSCAAPDDHSYGVSCITHGILQRQGYADKVHIHQYTTMWLYHRFGSVHVESVRIAVTVANFPDDWRLLGTETTTMFANGTCNCFQVHQSRA